MKITTKQSTYERVMAMPRPTRKKPLRPMMFLQILIRILAWFTLLPNKFSYTTEGMEKIGKKEPCLILMNHSSFADMEIASQIFFPRRYGIICTSDAFIGWLMKILMPLIGCIPTQKFVSDVSLIRDMEYMLKKKKTSILMYPEASYSFDGTATPLPRKMGILLKKLGVPVVTVITEGAFTRQPLYNCLRKRKVQVSAKVKCLATAEEVKSMSVAQLDALLDEAFGFDNFKWQQENNVVINEPERAEGLNRILFRCPHCNTEGNTEGKGTTLTCHNCGKVYELTETGFLKALDGDAAFTHVPDWYAWERDQVRQELIDGTYKLDVDVKIGMMVNLDAIYMVGDGHLTHDVNGFHLTGCDGKLDYAQGPLACYSLYSDYYWYETRLAAEELYKLKKRRRAPVTQ